MCRPTGLGLPVRRRPSESRPVATQSTASVFLPLVAMTGAELSAEAFVGLEPQAFWRHFHTLTTIARPSRQEELAAAHVKDWAAGHGFEVAEDEIGNLVVRVPATDGREAAPTVVLQGHLDMVCERQPDSPYDPTEGRIRVVRDGEWLTADGTTLGADDGVAIAAMMALTDDASLPHGPLELLMTVREEVGLEGVQALDGSLVSGSILLNLDSEEDGRLTVGCAGSTDTWLRVKQAREPTGEGAVGLGVTVAGGKGGHSGSNIAQGRSNAVKALGRVLREAHEAVPFRLASLEGGKSRNAIPRDAAAVCVVDKAREQELTSAIEAAAAGVRDAYKVTDPGVDLTVASADPPAEAWAEESTRRLLDVLALVPSGPISMSSEFENGSGHSRQGRRAGSRSASRRVSLLLTSRQTSGALSRLAPVNQFLYGGGEGGLEVDQFRPSRPDHDAHHAIDVHGLDLRLPLLSLLGGHLVGARSLHVLVGDTVHPIELGVTTQQEYVGRVHLGVDGQCYGRVALQRLELAGVLAGAHHDLGAVPEDPNRDHPWCAVFPNESQPRHVSLEQLLAESACSAPRRPRPPALPSLLAWWAWQDLNLQPTDYESAALTELSYRPQG